MKKYMNRTTLPLDQNTGVIFKIEMNLSRSRMHPNERTIVNMGAHLMTNDIAEKIEDKAMIEADYEREMAEEEFLQRDGNIYQALGLTY